MIMAGKKIIESGHQPRAALPLLLKPLLYKLNFPNIEEDDSKKCQNRIIRKNKLKI